MNEITWPIVALAIALAALWLKALLEARATAQTFFACVEAVQSLRNRIRDLENKR